jgi:hypothetical protein
MRGSIRMGVGFLMVFTAVGTLDADPNASLLSVLLLAAVGLLSMFSGVNAMQREENV